MNKDKTLLDLPVYPKDRDVAAATSEIVDTYLDERKKIISEYDLTSFVARWRNIFQLKEQTGSNELSESELSIVTGDFNVGEVLTTLKQLDTLTTIEQKNEEIAATIAAPIALISASILGRKYGVGSDLIMVRLYLDPYEEFDEMLRG